MGDRTTSHGLDELRDKILLLGGATESAVHRAIEALTERDSELAKKVLEQDSAIDQMELEIDGLSIDILASLQPTEHDLRFVISVAKITPILERWAEQGDNPLPSYAAGEWGPPEADRLIESAGRRWRPI